MIIIKKYFDLNNFAFYQRKYKKRLCLKSSLSQQRKKKLFLGFLRSILWERF